MVIVKLQGGLGNQMFQYAIGKAISVKHNTAVKLDLSFLLDRSPKESFVFRDYDLDIFNLDVEFSDIQERNKFAEAKKWWNQPLDWISSGNFKNVYYREKSFEFDFKALRHKNIYLDGYWQSPKYFMDIEYIIRENFSIKNPLLHNSERVALDIVESNSVCLNVRRTDFVNLENTNKFHGVKENEYFEKAIDLLSSKVANLKIFVFSDDITWCIENLRFGFSTTFLTHEYAGDKFQNYFQLMLLCKHFIIPNSTFAWWAAWLSKNPNKIVIAPNQWFNSNIINMSDLIPVDWLRV